MSRSRGRRPQTSPSSFLGHPPATVPADCLATPVNPNLPNGGDVDTLQTVGANGILGIGDGSVDCGSGCTGIATDSTFSGYPYYICPGGNCEEGSATTFIRRQTLSRRSPRRTGMAW